MFPIFVVFAKKVLNMSGNLIKVIKAFIKYTAIEERVVLIFDDIKEECKVGHDWPVGIDGHSVT